MADRKIQTIILVDVGAPSFARRNVVMHTNAFGAKDFK
jgi:hypothetical protein